MNIYIGYDSREEEAYNVCKKSLEPYNHTIIPIKSADLIKNGVYNRSKDSLASTEFTYTRFLTPFLNEYKDWVLFVDCDFIFLEDPAQLLKGLTNDKAVYVVKHPDYHPRSNIKMDNKIQSKYPRKNWSSFIFWNCDHVKCKAITPDVVNTQTPAYLHRFTWLDDKEIGSLSIQWNWLVGYYQASDRFKPKALHYTDGGPWFDAYKDCEYSDIYYKFKKMI